MHLVDFPLTRAIISFIEIAMDAFDRFSASLEALTDHSDSDFTPAPRRCPDCDSELDGEGSAIGGTEYCIECCEKRWFPATGNCDCGAGMFAVSATGGPPVHAVDCVSAVPDRRAS